MEIESEGFGAGLDSYMANRPKQSKDLQKALRDFRIVPWKFKRPLIQYMIKDLSTKLRKNFKPKEVR